MLQSKSQRGIGNGKSKVKAKNRSAACWQVDLRQNGQVISCPCASKWGECRGMACHARSSNHPHEHDRLCPCDHLSLFRYVMHGVAYRFCRIIVITLMAMMTIIVLKSMPPCGGNMPRTGRSTGSVMSNKNCTSGLLRSTLGNQL